MPTWYSWSAAEDESRARGRCAVKVSPECLPCIVRLVLETARKAGSDEWLHKKVLLEAMDELRQMDLDRTPAEVVHGTLRTAMKLLGNVQAFADVKRQATASLKQRENALKAWLASAPDPLEAGVRLATAGNAFDALMTGSLDPQRVLDGIATFVPAINEFAAMRERLDSARRIVYIFDNAGEALLDAWLVEKLAPGREITCVARRDPLWNDVGVEDLRELGLEKIATVVDPGTDGLGLPVALISTEFRRVLDAADLVIAKGAANLETLEETSLPVVFLLMVKCARVAQHLTRQIGDGVVLMNRKKTGTRVYRDGTRVTATGKK